jgi:hypothetical protein
MMAIRFADVLQRLAAEPEKHYQNKKLVFLRTP